MNFTKNDISFIIDALNFYWNDALQRMINEKNLGDLERKDLSERKTISQYLMNKIMNGDNYSEKQNH